MPPNRGRASKACVTCRKQKTRCYAGDTSHSRCLRCETLGLPCSLYLSDEDASPIRSASSRSISATDERLRRLESTVSTLLDRIGERPEPRSRKSTPDHGNSRGANTGQSNTPKDSPPPPVYIIRDLAAEIEADLPNEGRQVLGASLNSNISSRRITNSDILVEGLITPDQALSFVEIFLEHYGRWVAFECSTAPGIMLSELRKSNLLFCAICLIAVRHTSQELATRIAPTLFERAKAEMSRVLVMAPQTLQYFQATLILCMWSTTAGQLPLSIDSWLLSGFALQHCLISDEFKPIISRRGKAPGSSRRMLNLWSIWNHLCLVHLHYCMGTRRKSMIDADQIAQCRLILDSDHVTNFETRMVAEVNLYWCMYDHCSGHRVDLPKVQSALHSWKQEWKFVLDQPRSQFLEMGFSFAQLLAYERSLHSRSAKVRDSLLSEMARLSASIINLAMDTTDDRTKHLSDHIYHMITFAAVTLCRLLNLYEAHLATSHNIADYDKLILDLAIWLHSIGLPSHAAHTLGNIVAGIHKKLRPNAQQVSPVITELPSPWMDSGLSQFFPDLLGTDTDNNGAWNFIPDWEPFYSGTST